jgi:hypothetical protein
MDRSYEVRDCIVCNGFGSVDPSERIIDWSRPELGTTRNDVSPQLEACPVCKGAGKDHDRPANPD